MTATPPSSPQTTGSDAIAIFRKAAAENLADPLRRGSMLHFPNYGQLVLTGDMHGHRANFEKLKRYAFLERAAVRHVILHELIHAETSFGQPDPSHQLLLEAARYKCEFPDQVHFLQSNHELSQLTAHQILKGGRPVLEDFQRGVAQTYGKQADGVYAAIMEFLASFPIAARTQNRVWISHSLPAIEDLDTFDSKIFDRDLRPADLESGGSVYSLVWGRRFSETHLQVLSRMLDADYFVIGHIPQETGFAVRFDRVVILASDHNHGTFLPLDLSLPTSIPEMTNAIRKFVSVP